LIDIIATAVKKMMGKIDIDAAIAQVIESVKDRFGDIGFEIDTIKERINPTKKKSQNKARAESNNEPNSEPKNDFINKMGKKSLLNRLHQGGNGIHTHELELRGLDYEISNQETDAEAKDLLTE
jgi:hypothetical protein